jgi:hypothetical protein
MLGVPVLIPARSSKVLLVKKFPTQSSGHPFGDGWGLARLRNESDSRGLMRKRGGADFCSTPVLASTSWKLERDFQADLDPSHHRR